MAVIRDSRKADTDVVHAFTVGLSRGDLDSCQALLHPGFVFSEAESLPFGGERHGTQGFLDLLAAVARDYRVILDHPQISDAGDQVLVRVGGSIGSRATGRRMALNALDLYTLQDGLIARIEVFYKDTAAVIALCVGDASGAHAAATEGGFE
jgi:ketosteroid isomerase-like protein